MKDGKVSEVGTYTELLSHDGAFAELIRTYLTEDGEEEEDDDEEGKGKDYVLTKMRLSTFFQSCHSEFIKIISMNERWDFWFFLKL